MFKDIFLALWFFLPAAVANMVPILVAPLPLIKRFDAPIDGNRTYRGKRIFGAHKTWRGLIAGVVFATLVLWLEQLAVAHVHSIATLTHTVDYASLPTFILGPLFGIGALGGDAIKSFFKRQYGVAPGRSWFPFDQIDYIIGGTLAAALVVRLNAMEYLWLVVIWLAAHLVSSYIGYLLGLKERPI